MSTIWVRLHVHADTLHMTFEFKYQRSIEVSRILELRTQAAQPPRARPSSQVLRRQPLVRLRCTGTVEWQADRLHSHNAWRTTRFK